LYPHVDRAAIRLQHQSWKEHFMRLSFASGILCAGLFAVSCTPREFNGSEASNATDTIANAVSGPVNPKTFNAFNIWRDGKGTPILDYPAGYDVQEGKIDPDGVFYVASSTYWQNIKFIGSVTEGAKVEADLLTYPTKEGRTLVLKFSAPAENMMDHANAVQYCMAKGLRLPHIQEIFDFCAAGTAKDWSGEYINSRCAERHFWSASVVSSSRNYAWQFNGHYGNVKDYDRYSDNGVRCVGAP
jgi:hypothetical protein